MGYLTKSVSRSLRLYHNKEKPNEISAIEWSLSDNEGTQEVYISNNQIEGTFENWNYRSYPDGWSLKVDNTGKVVAQNYVLRSDKLPGEEKRGSKLTQFSAKEIKKLKKAGFDPRLIALASLLQGEKHVKSPVSFKSILSIDGHMDEVELIGKLDLGLVPAAIIGVFGVFPENDPTLLATSGLLIMYSLFYFFNQKNTINKGLSTPFREQRKLAFQSRDLQLYLSTFRQWLAQVFI